MNDHCKLLTKCCYFLDRLKIQDGHLKPLNQIKANLAGMVVGWSLFNIVSDLLQIKMNSNFKCSYMAMSSLIYILGFSVRFFQPVYSVQKYYEIKITSKSFAQKFELKLSLDKLCVTPPFSINFRCQIENQVSDYRLLGTSSLFLEMPN